MASYKRETSCFRTKAGTKGLWKAIIQGKVDTIGTDHSPQTVEMKKDQRIGGLLGLEITLPLMYSECIKRGLIPSKS